LISVAAVPRCVSCAFSRLVMRRPTADDAVALADGVVEAGQLHVARGGYDPEAELADFDLDKLACLKVGF
jgi:hypothetical protein